MLAVTLSGLFAAAFTLALQSFLICLLGERTFRKLALPLQCLGVTVLVMMMLLFPVISGVVPEILRSDPFLALCFPPFWFLGIYQQLLEGPTALSIYNALARTGISATLLVCAVTVLTYPLAYLRKMSQLVEGASARRTINPLLRLQRRLLHATLIRHPLRRAVFHFISQTILRVPRYRIYLVLYGGVGLSVVTATVLRFTVIRHQIHVDVSADGLRAATGIIIFWIIAGVRMAFFSSGNQHGRWVFRFLHGNPPDLPTAMQQSAATRTWVILWSLVTTVAAALVLHDIAPAELAAWRAFGAQAFLAIGLCVLLTDAFFLDSISVPFTSEQAGDNPNLALTVLKYFTFFPVVAALPIRVEPWIEKSSTHAALFAIGVIALHVLLTRRHRATLREHCNQAPIEEDEEDFPMKLGLRY